MSIEERLKRMEDIHAITNLKALYTEGADSSATHPHNGDAVADLFTEDAIWHIVPTGGPIEGREAIRRHFSDSTLFPYSYHMMGNPWIEVDGDRARGRWHVTVLFNMRDVGSMWVTGFYEDEFVRTADGWKISKLRCTASAAAPSGQGW